MVQFRISRWRLVVLATAGAVALTASMSWVLIKVARGDLGTGDQAASVVSMLLGAASLVVSLIGLRQTEASANRNKPEAELGAELRGLIHQAGEPSLRSLESAIRSAGGPTSGVRERDLSKVLQGATRPTRELVAAIVEACAKLASQKGIAIPDSALDRSQWQARYDHWFGRRPVGMKHQWRAAMIIGTAVLVVTVSAMIFMTEPASTAPTSTSATSPRSAQASSSALSADRPPPVTFTVTRMGTSSGSPCRSYWVPTEISKIGSAPSREGLSDWVFARGGAEIATTDVLVTIRGSSPDPVTITGLTFHVAKRQDLPTSGTTVSLQRGGGQEAKYILADLDFEPPKVLASSAKVLLIGDQNWRTTPLTFPYVVSSTESETLLVMAATKGLVVWTAELLWSDGATTGHSTIDDNGKAFMTTCDPRVPQIYLALSGDRWEDNPSAPSWPCDTSVAESIAG